MNSQIVKQHIWKSFCELLDTTPFEKITVEHIASYSGISKSTFYRNFRDKYDVMNYNSEEMASRITGGKYCRDWKDFFLFMFQEIQKNRGYYRKVFRTSGQNAHSNFLYEYCYEFVKSHYLASCHRAELSIHEVYMIRHYCHGCVETLDDWIRDQHPMSAEDMSSLYFDAMPDILKLSWDSNLS